MMNAGRLIGLYFACVVAFLTLDSIWLTIATPRLYRPYLGPLLAEKPNIGVAVPFYLVYIVGLIALAVLPGLGEASVVGAVWRGALLGLLAYATYDLTNLATIQGWAWQVSVADLVWGTALNAVVAAIGYFAGQWLGLRG